MALHPAPSSVPAPDSQGGMSWSSKCRKPSLPGPLGTPVLSVLASESGAHTSSGPPCLGELMGAVDVRSKEGMDFLKYNHGNTSRTLAPTQVPGDRMRAGQADGRFPLSVKNERQIRLQGLPRNAAHVTHILQRAAFSPTGNGWSSLVSSSCRPHY